MEKIFELDEQFLVYLNQMGSAEQDDFWLLITNWWAWLPFFAFIFWITFRYFSQREAWQIVYYVVLTLFVTASITSATKELVERLRPLHTESLIPYLRIITTEKGYSFFSGHTSNSFAVCTFLYLVFRKRLKWAFWVYIWAIPYAFSRLYLGVHFPLDILVGFLVGISIAHIFFYYYDKRKKHRL